jgi:hypothetical protein
VIIGILFYQNGFFAFLLRQRAKAELAKPIAPHLQKWQPSAANPDGELVTEINPPPVGQFLLNTNRCIYVCFF